MIDVEKLQRAVDDAPGDALAVSKIQMSQMLEEIRRGHAARTSLASLRSTVTVVAATGCLRVPGGYSAPSGHPAP